jgi:hypothetical protein
VDLTRPVEYRGVQLNSPVISPTSPIVGNQIETVDYSEVPGVGYVEKRAAADGYDASDITLGARNVVLIGTCYGANRADLFDRLQALRYAFSPTAAFADEPGDYGYIPLNFEVPTGLLTDWPLGVIPQCIRVRPSRNLGFNIRRDGIGGKDVEGMSIPWQAPRQARDPRIYAQDEREYTTWVGAVSGSGTFVNRGDYPAPLNIILASNAGDAASTLTLNIAGSTMLLTMPANATKPQILRYDGVHKVVTLQVDTTVSLRMDLLKFTSAKTHPLVGTGSNPFTWTRGVAPKAGSRMWFWESWA